MLFYNTFIVIILLSIIDINVSYGESTVLLDSLVFGNSQSEKSHNFSGPNNAIITGGLEESARQLKPLKPISWEGGRMSFTLKVDNEKQNYFTIRLWGSDVSENRLILFLEGKQIGYHHLGDIDILDFGSDSGEPAYNDRFFYNTCPLPIDMTKGKSILNFEIRSIGRIWGYGTTFEQYQKNMTDPSRGIYRVYTHTDGFFNPPPDEKQGNPHANPPVRSSPGHEVMDKLKERVNKEINNLLHSVNPLNEMQLQFLSKAYYVKWTNAYNNSKTVEQVMKSIDHIFKLYRNDTSYAHSTPGTYNPDWFGLGPCGDAVWVLADQLKPFLHQDIDDGKGKKVQRLAAWSEMLKDSRDWHRYNRRLYTNQGMIVDLNTYAANRGIAAIDSINALPDQHMRELLYQAIGISPWLGNENDNGWQKSMGDNYYQLTQKGLTRELGFVGYYGEVLDWVRMIYDVTRSKPNQSGDEKIKAQLEKIIDARAVFRYPMVDGNSYRAMRAETIVGWRDSHYPGDVTYAERNSWDGSPIYAPAASLDSRTVGYVQQMFADNQFFKSVEDKMKDGGFRTTYSLLYIPEDYDTIKAQPDSTYRLPMASGQPDFVFADEEDGVVAFKRGTDIFYASLYWRARYAINFLARIHYITPDFDRIAVVRQETKYQPSNSVYTRPDWIDMGFAGGGHKYPGNLHSAHTGEKLPIAKVPVGNFHPGDENSYAGKGEFYALRYGPYLIGMNCAKNATYNLSIPSDVHSAQELVSRQTIHLGTSLAVKPFSTVVLFLG
jgi:hypothetical protein